MLEPYDTADDRQDLRVVPRPLYLSECLDYLNTPETEENDYHHQEAVLHDLARLVRSRPADLTDYAPELARRLTRLENKYNMDHFTTLVSESLCALVVEDPIAVGMNLIEELFEDGSLRDRLTILHALDEASYELSGNRQLENSHSVEQHRLGTPSGASPRSTGKRSVVVGPDQSTVTTNPKWNGKLDDRTRRWGRGRHHVAEPTVIENRFAKVAPEWFYLLTGRFMHCKNKTNLWGGEVGATFLSSLVLTLGRIVTCTGPYTPGVEVLAQDLWELVWPLRLADIAEVRASVLSAAGTSLCYLSEQALVTLLMDSSTDNLITNIQCICENDKDSDCRALANQLRTVVATTLKATGDSRLLK